MKLMASVLRSFYTEGRITPVIALLFPALWILSLIYGAAMKLRRFLYDRGLLRSYRPASRVVSVGNLTLGGSGKTPMVAYLAEYFKARGGRRTAILIRGYKRPSEKTALGDEDFRRMGDEASMLKNMGIGSVVASRERAREARRLDAEGATDVIILDDGFQHVRLARDLEIVLVDATRPFGNGCVLPAGPLREFRGALRYADVLCVTRADEAPAGSRDRLRASLAGLNPRALLIESAHRTRGLYDLMTGKPESLNVLSGAGIGLFSAIANPASFLHSVESAGGRIVVKKFFEDHHVFLPQEIRDIIREGAQRGVRVFVTTQKDAPRLAGLLPPQDVRLFVLKVGLEITRGEKEFHERLSSL